MDLILPIIFAITSVDGSCYRVIDSSILKEFFSSLSNFYHALKKKGKSWEKIKKEWI